MKSTEVVKDALALISSADREDRQAVEYLLSVYQGPGNDAARGELVGAILSHAVCIARMASAEIGIPVDKILGAVAAQLAE